VLSEVTEIKGRWQRYFAKLLNGEAMEDPHSRESEGRERRLDLEVCGLITKSRLKRPYKR